MVLLSILLTRHHRLLSVAAILDVFETVNVFYIADGKNKFFDISLISAEKSAAVNYPGYATQELKGLPRQDIILIPAFSSDDINAALESNACCIEWLQLQYQKGTEIASFCTGAFLLAATGLLNNKPVTTHIQVAPALAKAFPKINLLSREISTFDKGIYTSGGATNSFYLMLRILEKYCDRDMVVRIAKYFAIDMNREQQTYFSTFQPEKKHQDALVRNLQERIENNFSEVATIEKLLEEIPSSRRNLVRRFKGATGITPIEYLQKTRMEAARRFLEQTDHTVLEIMLDVGYNDLKAFRFLFRKNTGMTPTEYREKFSQMKVVA